MDAFGLSDAKRSQIAWLQTPLEDAAAIDHRTVRFPLFINGSLGIGALRNDLEHQARFDIRRASHSFLQPLSGFSKESSL